MADEQAKNSANLGELFVEFGSKGMGGLIKGLNSVSASFLLTKNAGQQMLQPLANMSKQAGQGVIALDKLNSVTGINVKQLYRLKQWTKLNNIDFNDYIGQIHSLQNALGRMALGDSGAIQGFAMLGLNPADFNPAKPLENMQKVKKAMLDMYKRGGEGAKYQISLALQLLGLNEDLAYSFLNANKSLDEQIRLTDKEQEQLENLTTATNGLGVAWNNFIKTTTARLSHFVIPLLDKTSNLINDIYSSNAEKKKEARTKIIQGGIIAGATTVLGAAAGGAAAGSIAPGVGTAIGGIIGLGSGLWMLNKSASQKEDWEKKVEEDKKFWNSFSKNNKTFGYTDADIQELGKNGNLPKVLKSKNNAASTIMTNTDNRKAEININVEQNVTGDNAQQSADDVINIIQDNLYTQLGFNFIINQNGGFNK